MRKFKSKKKSKYIRVFSLHHSKVGLIFAAVFFGFSLFPSLLPRDALFQGAISGIVVAIGYGLGSLSYWLWNFFEIPSPPVKYANIIKRVLIGLAFFVLLSATWQYVGWQNSVRAVFGVENINFLVMFPILFITLIVFSIIIIIGRSIRKLFQFIDSKLKKVFPKRLSAAAGVVVVLLFMSLVFRDVLVDGFFAASNQFFSSTNGVVDEGAKPPESTLRSGGKDSIVSWDSLGREGRRFVNGGPTVADINAFSGGNAKEPIRVYAGLESAEDMQSRADIVLEELKRTGAFDRQVILVTTTTGSGWLDPKAMDPFEYINNGDSAIVGTQYSYLPSWISLLADQDTVKESSRITFKTIHDYWATLPDNDRPEFYLFGLSLGSFGAETNLNSIEIVNEPINGALLEGPPFVNQLSPHLVATRDEGTPPWQPTINNGQTVRYTASENALYKPEGEWGENKIVYIQHSSDPVVWYSPRLLFNYPEWLERGQRGPDITEDFVWVPIVTMFQVGLDLPAASAVPNGYGHNYAVDSAIDGWTAIIEPAGWNNEKTDRLKELLVPKYED